MQMNQMKTTRRNLLSGLGAGTAALMSGLPTTARTAELPTQGQFDTDVIVIGAGYAGLACARALNKAGRQALVLEARDRVGGRCLNLNLPSPYEQYVVEGGAEFIGPTQDRMYQLVNELGLQTFPAYDTGNQVSYIQGNRRVYNGVLPWTGLFSTGEVGIAMLRLDSMANDVPLESPWAAKKAAEWDAQTMQGWIDSNLFTDSGRSLMRLAVLSLMSAEPSEVSFLFMLTYIRRGGGLDSLLSTSGGAQQDRIVGGSQAIALAMANRLPGNILYNAAAHTVTQSGGGVSVQGHGFEVRGQRVVVAMAPWMASRIRFEPLDGLTQNRLQMGQRVPMGSAWKMHVVYDTPFWRADGLSGQVISDAYLPKIVFDNTPSQSGAPGVLMAFIDGKDARDAGLMSPAVRRQHVLKALSVYFGPRALQLRAYTETNWQGENFSAGGPVGVFPPGVLTGFGAALKTPIGKLHWAGTETASTWMGYMEGAVRSGERAAMEILQQG